MDNKPMNNDAMMHEWKTACDMKAWCCETKWMCDSKGSCSDMKADCCSTKMDCCTMKKWCCGGSCGKHVVMIIVALVIIGWAFMCGMRMGRGNMRHYGMDRDNMMGDDTMKGMYECMMTDGATRDKCTDMMKTMMQDDDTNTTTTATGTN